MTYATTGGPGEPNIPGAGLDFQQGRWRVWVKLPRMVKVPSSTRISPSFTEALVSVAEPLCTFRVPLLFDIDGGGGKVGGVQIDLAERG